MLTASQADTVINRAIAHYTEASAIYTRMSTMATWTPEYDGLKDAAAAHMAAGQADQARYTAWRDQAQLNARIDAALADALTPEEMQAAEEIEAADRRDDPLKMETTKNA